MAELGCGVESRTVASAKIRNFRDTIFFPMKTSSALSVRHERTGRSSRLTRYSEFTRVGAPIDVEKVL